MADLTHLKKTCPMCLEPFSNKFNKSLPQWKMKQYCSAECRKNNEKERNKLYADLCE